MKRKKQIRESEYSKRRLELLRKYYPIDDEKKIITVKLYYEHASELLDYSVGEEGKEMFNDDFLEKVTEIFKRIPFGYKVDVLLEIKDYDVYDEEIIMEKFNDFLEINSFDVVQYGKKNNLLASGLILVGLCILTMNAILSSTGAYGDSAGLEYNILKEVLDITSWVFIWQAVTVLFLSPSDSGIYILSVTRKMNSLGIVRNGDVKLKEDRNVILDKCMMDTTKDKTRNYTLLISSVLLIFIGVISILSPFLTALTSQEQGEINVPEFVSNIIAGVGIGVLLALAGILGISKFSNKNYNVKAIFPLVIFIFVLVVIVWIISIVAVIMGIQSYKMLLSVSAEASVFVAYIVSYALTKKKNKSFN